MKTVTLGLHNPILTVEVEDVLTFGGTCKPAVTSAIPHAVEATLAELKE